MDGELIVEPDAAAVAYHAAAHLAALAAHAVKDHDRFILVLSGGGTPNRLYRLLTEEPWRTSIPWQQTHVLWGDERHLPHGDAGRNDTSVLPLLREIGVPEPNLYPVPYVAGDPSAAAELYEAQLQDLVRPDAPLLDLVVLGMGTDGHTASLFPGTPALNETKHLVAANVAHYEDRHPERVTLTLAAINAAATVIFLVTGAGKRAILHQVLEEPEQPPLPAQRVHPTYGRLLWLVDRAAWGDA